MALDDEDKIAILWCILAVVFSFILAAYWVLGVALLVHCPDVAPCLGSRVFYRVVAWVDRQQSVVKVLLSMAGSPFLAVGVGLAITAAPILYAVFWTARRVRAGWQALWQTLPTQPGDDGQVSGQAGGPAGGQAGEKDDDRKSYDLEQEPMEIV